MTTALASPFNELESFHLDQKSFHNNVMQGPPGGDTTLTRVFVGGLPWTTESEALHEYFTQFGSIVEAIVIKDRRTGRSKGYGFVTFHDASNAVAATQDPNPMIDGRKANCNLAFLGAKKKKAGTTLHKNDSTDSLMGNNTTVRDEDVVTFNVGGTKYETSRQTLSRFPDSLLPSITQNDPSSLTGEYFIDRNSRAFEWILDVYRHGCLVERSDVPQALLQEELAFYGLGGVGTSHEQRYDLKELALSISQERVHSVVSSVLDMCDDVLLEAAQQGKQQCTINIGGYSPTSVWWCNKNDRRAEFRIDVEFDTSLDAEYLRELEKRAKKRYGVHSCSALSVSICSEFRSTDYVPFFYLMGYETTGVELAVEFFEL